MIEVVQDKLKAILQSHLETELKRHDSICNTKLSLPPPQQYFLDFDINSTVINQYPACIIFGFRTTLDDRLSVGLRVVQRHTMAITHLLVNRDLDELQRIRSRYAGATLKLLKDINLGKYDSAGIITMIDADIDIVYDRILRDERDTSFLGSVWVLFEAREDGEL